MALNEEATKVILEETKILSGVVDSLHSQRSHKLGRLQIENKRARELTSEMVRTRRDEEKWLLASDEAVSHGIKDKQKSDVEIIDRLLKQPYFARMVLNEDSNGIQKQIEYKIGLAENSDCRIIDWRKAPIAKLYYEYKEGDDYCEEIQGRERAGTVAVRNMLETSNGILTQVVCRHGSFVLKNSEWEPASGTLHPHEASNAPHDSSEAGTAQNLLPQIASLLSPEQFSLISENAGKAMLIQGIAGSGKTTIALHRLAWLFADAAIAPAPGQCLVLVLSHSLKTYISRTLPSLGVDGVRVLTFVDWTEELISKIAPRFCYHDAFEERSRIKRPQTALPAGIDRLKRSMAMLRAVENFLQRNSANRQQLASLAPDTVLLSTLKSPREIIEQDETHLIDERLIKAALERTIENSSAGVMDRCDDALFVRIHSLLTGGVFLKDGSFGKYEHIFVDEVQDFSPIDLACVLGSIKETNNITIVGDTAQKIDPDTTFPGWDKLRRYWSLKESLSRFVSLDLSYRSTIEVLKLADYIQHGAASSKAEGRHGRVPIWFKCLSEHRGIDSAREWLTKAIEKYPAAITAVVCRNQAIAKHVLSLLKPAFGPLVRLGDDKSFSFEGGIIVTHAMQVRGLEFANLLVWNPLKSDYPADPVHRNLLYLTISRARENVCIVTWGKHTELLPPLHSPLIRGYDIAREELEQMEEDKMRLRQA